MFDNIHLHAGPNETRVTKTVHEHRAPTDDSVKLLIELTEKARSHLVATFSTSNNTLQATWAHYEDIQTAHINYLCKFTMNGVDHQICVKSSELGLYVNKDLVDLLYEGLCAKLSGELMAPLLKEMKCLVR